MLPETRFHVAHLDLLEHIHGFRDKEAELAEQSNARRVLLGYTRDESPLITDG